MKLKYLIMLPLCFSGMAHSELRYSGFLSLNLGKVLSTDTVYDPVFTGEEVERKFLADYPNASVYDKNLSIEPETLAAIQFDYDILSDLSATVQLVSRGASDFTVEPEWAYLTYEFSDNFSIQAGKKRLPLFYYSDFFDLGYAYVWMRPPSDTYTWHILNYKGVNLTYTDEWGDWSVNANIYGGERKENINKFLTEVFNREPTTEFWDKIRGAVFSTSYEFLEIRASYMQYQTGLFPDDDIETVNTETKKFYGLAINMDFDDWFILSEYNEIHYSSSEYKTMMGTIAKRIGDDYTVYFAYSSFNTTPENEFVEKHSTHSVGARWDFNDNAAFKMQLDSVKDDRYSVLGGSEAITFGIDYVF